MSVLEVCKFRGLAVLFHDGLTQRPFLVEAFLMDLIQSLLNSFLVLTVQSRDVLKKGAKMRTFKNVSFKVGLSDSQEIGST